MPKVQQICTFLIGNQTFGVPVSQVQEVIRFQPITPVPLAPGVVDGMINLRGQIVIAIDLRRRLGLNRRASGDPMNVIVRTAAGAVSLLVDKIGDVVEVDEDSFEPPPPTAPPETRELLLGIYKLQARLLHLLDTEKVCQVQIAAPAGTL
ncbi:MAG TPA: chemotaxis protein CheW [Verrucomicrobiae bacterium]|jgi:purine-binding chemotaxis protein CheW|nr:chemotaxis protein CheW [Verrucomicrobiae bacterium]